MGLADVTTAGLCDVPAIEALVSEAFGPYTEPIGSPPGPLGEDYNAIVAEGRALVVRREHRVVGLLVTSVHPDYLLVETLAVAETERGSGLGTTLLDRADDQACAAGLAEIRLYTNESMIENLAFYPRRGFQETGRRSEGGFSRVFFARRAGMRGR